MKKHLLPSLISLTGALFSVAAPLPVGFAPPELTLSDFNAREIVIGDFNRDGRKDIATLNPDRARIDLHLQQDPDNPKASPESRLDANRWRPMLSHPRFQRDSLIPGNPLIALAAGDFNGDGVEDLATTDDQDMLLVYHGPIRGGDRPAHRLSVPEVRSGPGTLVWDPEEQVLVLLGEDSVSDIFWSPEDAQYHTNTTTAPPANSNPRRLMLGDMNEDGRSDVMYTVRGDRFPVVLHTRGPGGLGNIHRPLFNPPVTALTPFDGRPGQFLGLHPRSRAVLHIKAEKVAGTGSLEKAGTLDARFVHIPTLRDPLLLWKDLNRDGHLDGLLLSPGSPEATLLPGTGPDTVSAPTPVPVPAGVQWAVAGEFLPEEEAPQVLFHDPDTGYLGLSHWEEDRLTFPDTLQNADTLVAAATWRPAGTETDRLVAIMRDEDREYHLCTYLLTQTEQGLTFETVQKTPLPDVDRDPLSPVSIPIHNGEHGPGFLVPSPFGDAFFLFPDGEGSLTVQPTAPGFSTERLERISSRDLHIFPAESPLPSTWGLTENKSIQFFQVNARGEVDVVDQLNLKQGTRLSAVLPLDAEGNRIGLVDDARNHLEIFDRKENGSYAFNRVLDLPSLDVVEARLFSGRDGEPHLRIRGRTHVALVFPRPPRTRFTVETLYESDLPTMKPAGVLSGDFNGDQRPEIALVDGARQHLIEFLHLVESDWATAMHFQVFEAAPAVQARRGSGATAREAEVADMNGDGLDDLLLLIHDRILLYLQDPIPVAE